METELVNAIGKIRATLIELEKDYRSKTLAEQQDHLFKHLMIVLDRFVNDDRDAQSIEWTLRAAASNRMGMAA